MRNIDRALDYMSFCQFLDSLQNAEAFLRRIGAISVTLKDEDAECTFQLGEMTISFDGNNWY